MNLQYTAALGCMSLNDVTKHLFVVPENSHIFTMKFQQTCSPQINSLGVFTVVDKLLQPARSGVMEFVTWCLQQFSVSGRVCFLCHCISTLKEKEIHKIRNEYFYPSGQNPPPSWLLGSFNHVTSRCPNEWALSAPSMAPAKLPLYGDSHKHTRTHTHTHTWRIKQSKGALH